ncbi:MAG TPA: BamA/TamA family outer membrane protein [Candidatus Eisenbacteria bacterium]
MPSARRGLRALLILSALLASQVLLALAARASPAEPRFGDSTGVAPAGAFEAEPESAAALDSPRVALPDQERGWETVLRTPFRVVFFPLRLLAGGLEVAAGYLGPRYLEPKPKLPPKQGLSLAPHVSIGTFSDFEIGPAIAWEGFPAAGSRLRLTGSFSAIDRRRATISENFGYARRVGLELRGDYDRKPNRRFYGIGNDTEESDLSYYRLEKTSADVALRLGATPRGNLRIAGGYSSMSPSRGSHGTPLLDDVYGPGGAPYGRRSTAVLWYSVAADIATLDDRRDPSRGVHGLADLRRASGARSGDPNFDRWRVEGRAYLPVFAKRRVVAVRGVYAGVEPRGATADLPYYWLTQSEGITRFAGYASQRFRDRQLLLARVEYRWQILHRLSAIGLYEMGAVAPRLEAFSIREAHRSYGGGLRLGQSDYSSLRLEVAKSDEGLHAFLELGSEF